MSSLLSGLCTCVVCRKKRDRRVAPLRRLVMDLGYIVEVKRGPSITPSNREVVVVRTRDSHYGHVFDNTALDLDRALSYFTRHFDAIRSDMQKREEREMQSAVVVPGLQHLEMIDQVERGMQLLDQDHPGWEGLVYLPDLDIHSSCSCVLGQVYRETEDQGFIGAVRRLFGIVWTRDVSDGDYQQLVEHGFAVDRRYYSEGEAAKLQLESVWRVLLQQRALVEQLAEKEHASWSHWMAYLFKQCTENSEDGSMTIPPALVARWHQQLETSYADLMDREKQADRNRVHHILPLIEAYKASSYTEVQDA